MTEFITKSKIMCEIDSIENELIGFDGDAMGFQESPAPADVRIARAVSMIASLQARIRKDVEGGLN
jgi:hypothetical protein